MKENGFSITVRTRTVYRTQYTEHRNFKKFYRVVYSFIHIKKQRLYSPVVINNTFSPPGIIFS